MSDVITIDGPSASGKGALAHCLAAHYDFFWLDSGLLYRAIAAQLHNSHNKNAISIAHHLTIKDLSEPSLRDERYGLAASNIARDPLVREALVAWQRNCAAHPPQGKKGLVMDGRDGGSVIFPDARYKLYLTASLETRAQRRMAQLKEQGFPANLTKVTASLAKRDSQDKKRTHAPLICPQDAFVIQSDGLSLRDVFVMAMRWLEQRGLAPDT